MGTHADSEGSDQAQKERPTDGPARESGSDEGTTSQDRPEEGSHAVSRDSGGQGSTAEPHVSPEGPADSNERADDRATVVDPGD